MKLTFSATMVFFALSSASAFASDWSSAIYERGPAARMPIFSADPIYKQIFDSVSQEKLTTLLQQLTGYLPVTVAGSSFSISNRYLPESKAQFRAFWLQYFQSLGIPAKEMAFPTSHHIGEANGHNLEAVLPGKSRDSVVVIVHYDSIGPSGRESDNPGVDDDMSGMATLMETARILAAHKGQLQNSVRFVAADYEELGGLEGARKYAAYLKGLSEKENFKIIASVDNEQSGWNCAADGLCEQEAGTPVDIFSCSGDWQRYNNAALGDSLAQVAATYGSMNSTRACMGEHSDHYALWEIGVPSVVYSEHAPFANPHFDAQGGDTYEKIDKNYFFQISRIGVTFAATLAGLSASVY